MTRRDWRHDCTRKRRRASACGWTTTWPVRRRRLTPSAPTPSSRCCEARPSARRAEPSSSTTPAPSSPPPPPTDDAVVASAVAGLAQHTGPSGLSRAATEFRFDHVTARPLSRETWLTYATRYREQPGRPPLDAGHGHARGVLSGGHASRQQPGGNGVRARAGPLAGAGRGPGVDGDGAAPAHCARHAGDGSRRPEHTGARQQARGTGRPCAIVQRHGRQAQLVVRGSGRRSRHAKAS